MIVFKEQWDKVPTEDWTQAGLEVKNAKTPSDLDTALEIEVDDLVLLNDAMVALTPPPDDQLTAPLSKPRAAVEAAIASLESAARQLKADAQANNDAAANRDYSGPYQSAYDALSKAYDDLDTAVRLDLNS